MWCHNVRELVNTPVAPCPKAITIAPISTNCMSMKEAILVATCIILMAKGADNNYTMLILCVTDDIWNLSNELNFMIREPVRTQRDHHVSVVDCGLNCLCAPH